MTPEKTDMRIVDLAGTKMARIEVQPGLVLPTNK